MINRIDQKIITVIASSVMYGEVFTGPVLRVDSYFKVAGGITITATIILFPTILITFRVNLYRT